MPLSKAAIEELKILYLEEYSEPLGDDDAWDLGHRIVRLVDLATRRIKPPTP